MRTYTRDCKIKLIFFFINFNSNAYFYVRNQKVAHLLRASFYFYMFVYFFRILRKLDFFTFGRARYWFHENCIMTNVAKTFF